MPDAADTVVCAPDDGWRCHPKHVLRTLEPFPTLPRQRQVAVTVWQVPDAADTVVCAPDDGWRYHPKHVEQFPDINKLCNVVTCWIFFFFRKSILFRIEWYMTASNVNRQLLRLGAV